MENNKAYTIEPPKSGIRNKLIFAFFLVLALGGIIINIISLDVIQTTLAKEGLEGQVIRNVSRQFTILGLCITIAAIVIVSLIAFLFSKAMSRPIRTLTKGMSDITEGRWDRRITVTGNDEMGKLAEGFNIMVKHIEDKMHELKAVKEYNDKIVLFVPSILIVLSNRFNILSTNMAFQKLKEQYPTLSHSQFVSPLIDDIRKNIETGATIKKEIIIVPEGSEVSLIFAATVSRIGENDLHNDEENASILLTITDVTERRKMKEMVLQSQQDWEGTFDMIPDMITIHDKDYNIIMANKAAKETLNIHLLEFKNSCKCFKYYHGTGNPPDGCPSCDCLKTEEAVTFELYEPHLKKFIEIRSIPRFNNNNELIGLIHIVRDISLRKNIENEHTDLLIAITKAKIEWEMTFDSVLEFIVLIDNDLKITRCNRSFTEFVKQPVAGIIGRHCHEFFPCTSAQVDDCKSCMMASRELLTKNELETENGRWLYISHRPIHDEKENLLNTVIIATDVTELKHAQQKIKESEKELKKKVDDLEKFYDMAIGREVRMKELKKEIKKLTSKVDGYKEIDVT
jgi:PAS domain S-box-containing protein